MSRPHVTTEEKMAMIRLAAVLENLHKTAHDPASGEEAGRLAAGEMGRTVLQHFDLITSALREAGKVMRV